MGTLLPISKRLARSASRLTRDPACLRVLELGAGTGQLTRALLKQGVKQENLVALELENLFCEFLRKTLPKVKVIQGDARCLSSLLPLSLQFDVIYSVIPLMYLPLEDRVLILNEAFSFLKPEGKLYHVCYTPISPIQKISTLQSRRLVSHWFNLPPGFVWEFSRADFET